MLLSVCEVEEPAAAGLSEAGGSASISACTLATNTSNSSYFLALTKPLKPEELKQQYRINRTAERSGGMPDQGT